MTPFSGANSETGRLQRVLVCRPDLAPRRLKTANCAGMLFDDVLWVSQARNDYDAVTTAMTEREVELLEPHDLLADTVADPKARNWLIERKLDRGLVAPETVVLLLPWLEALAPAQLVEHLVGGVARSELPFDIPGLKARCARPSDFLLSHQGLITYPTFKDYP